MSCSITLKEKGYRLTLQRGMILDIFHEFGGHLTAEDVLTQLRAKAPGVNKSTVYRTLELLEELGLVIRSEHEGRFIYHHAEEGRHHHLVCRRCGKIMECDTDVSLTLETALLDRFGFEGDLRHLVIHGVCAECRGKSK